MRGGGEEAAPQPKQRTNCSLGRPGLLSLYGPIRRTCFASSSLRPLRSLRFIPGGRQFSRFCLLCGLASLRLCVSFRISQPPPPTRSAHSSARSIRGLMRWIQDGINPRDQLFASQLVAPSCTFCAASPALCPMISEYDAILLGAGHNALVLQAYLSRAGMRTVSLERAAEPGGGLVTMANPRLPGHVHHLHSFFHRAITRQPWYRDLRLEQHAALGRGIPADRPEHPHPGGAIAAARTCAPEAPAGGNPGRTPPARSVRLVTARVRDPRI